MKHIKLEDMRDWLSGDADDAVQEAIQAEFSRSGSRTNEFFDWLRDPGKKHHLTFEESASSTNHDSTYPATWHLREPRKNPAEDAVAIDSTDFHMFQPHVVDVMDAWKGLRPLLKETSFGGIGEIMTPMSEIKVPPFDASLLKSEIDRLAVRLAFDRNLNELLIIKLRLMGRNIDEITKRVYCDAVDVELVLQEIRRQHASSLKEWPDF